MHNKVCIYILYFIQTGKTVKIHLSGGMGGYGESVLSRACYIAVLDKVSNVV